MRRTKIIATAGPASQSPEMLARLIEAGVDVFRLNFSHGKAEDHARVLEHVHAASKQAGRSVGILQDLQGPKIRLGEFSEGEVELIAGRPFTLITESVPGNSSRASCDYVQLPKEVEPGHRILIDDGRVVLKVVKIENQEVHCEVMVGGRVSARKGVNVPGVELSVPAMTEKDLEDLRFGISLGVDFVALSFVQRAADVVACRRIIAKAGTDIPVIAKIEKPVGLNNLEEILKEAWGVMVARGDLGVEMSPEKVPVAQKNIIRRAEWHRKVVITATQMLDSMRNNPAPTRAEASDVANAIFDGTDAVMLSGETAMGKYPVESVQMMDRICVEVERNLDIQTAPWTRHRGPEEGTPFDVAIASAAATTAYVVKAEVVVAFTLSGTTALHVSKNRLAVPIVGFTPIPKTLRRLALLRGVIPRAMLEVQTVDQMVHEVDAALQLQGLVKKGDEVVIVAGAPLGTGRPTNMMLVHRIGDV